VKEVAGIAGAAVVAMIVFTGLPSNSTREISAPPSAPVTQGQIDQSSGSSVAAEASSQAQKVVEHCLSTQSETVQGKCQETTGLTEEPLVKSAELPPSNPTLSDPTTETILCDGTNSPETGTASQTVREQCKAMKMETVQKITFVLVGPFETIESGNLVLSASKRVVLNGAWQDEKYLKFGPFVGREINTAFERLSDLAVDVEVKVFQGG
jgi:hypothetical protein